MKVLNWSAMVSEWNFLLFAACRALRSAVSFGADREMIRHWSRLIFRLDSGGIDSWGLTDLCLLIGQESRRPAAAPVLHIAQRRLTRRLAREVYVEGWATKL